MVDTDQNGRPENSGGKPADKSSNIYFIPQKCVRKYLLERKIEFKVPNSLQQLVMDATTRDIVLNVLFSSVCRDTWYTRRS